MLQPGLPAYLDRVKPSPVTLWRQDRLVEEAGAEAILCLQSGLCHEALQIDWPAIRERALERGVVITRVAVRDFDHNDQVSTHSCLRTHALLVDRHSHNCDLMLHSTTDAVLSRIFMFANTDF